MMVLIYSSTELTLSLTMISISSATFVFRELLHLHHRYHSYLIYCYRRIMCLRIVGNGNRFSLLLVQSYYKIFGFVWLNSNFPFYFSLLFIDFNVFLIFIKKDKNRVFVHIFYFQSLNFFIQLKIVNFFVDF